MMLSLATLIGCIYAASAASTIDVSWSLCTGNEAKQCPNGTHASLNNMVISPDTPSAGKNFSITGYGHTKEEIKHPSYELTVHDGFFVQADIKESGCDRYRYDFPLGLGHLYYDGVGCPVGKNKDITIPMKAWISPNAPGGTATAKMKIYDEEDQKGHCVTCVDIKMVIN